MAALAVQGQRRQRIGAVRKLSRSRLLRILLFGGLSPVRTMLIAEGATPFCFAHFLWPPARFTSERSKRTTSFWRGKGAIGEVRGPTTEKAVQSHSHFRPRALVARRQQRADFRLDPSYALLGRACAQIPAATFGKIAWSQRIA